MSELLQIFHNYPPSVASRCRQKLPVSALICPPCPSRPPCSPSGPAACLGESKVRYKLTYTCNRSTYAPCYSPAVPSCPPPPSPPPPPITCALEFFDCCGKPVGKRR